MSTMTTQSSGMRMAQPNAAATGGYRTLWRWHFYAALFVMPPYVASTLFVSDAPGVTESSATA